MEKKVTCTRSDYSARPEIKKYQSGVLKNKVMQGRRTRNPESRRNREKIKRKVWTPKGEGGIPENKSPQLYAGEEKKKKSRAESKRKKCISRVRRARKTNCGRKRMGKVSKTKEKERTSKGVKKPEENKKR